MKQSQKIIKYLAIAFALFLTFSIISIISYGVSFIGNLFDSDKDSITEKLNDLDINDNTLLLDINTSSSNITIKSGDVLKVETNNKYINSKQDNNKLYITEKKHNILRDNESEIIIYIPDDFIFDGVSIETGAGKVNIETLSTKKLYLNLGAGKVEINDLNVLEKAKVDGGAGEIVINAININNLDLDMGIGKFMLIGQLFGKTEIDQGIGTVDLNLLGNKDDYQIHLDKGLGSVKIDGNNINNDETLGNGNNKIDIDGGIGSIEINFTKNI